MMLAREKVISRQQVEIQEMEEMLEMVALVHSAVLDRWVVPAEPEVPQVLVVRHMQEV
jgi:hypothetical protein